MSVGFAPSHFHKLCFGKAERQRALSCVDSLLESLQQSELGQAEAGTRSVPVSQVGGRKSRVEPSPAARQGAQEPGGALAVLGPHVDAPVWEMVS